MLNELSRALWVMLGWLAVNTATAAGSYHFIAGMPSNSELPGDNFATGLFKLEADRPALSLVRTVTTSRQGSRFIRPYDDLGLVIIAASGGPGRAQFDLVSYDNPAKIQQIETTVGASKFFPVSVFLFDLAGQPMIGIQESSGVLGSQTSPVTLVTTGVSLTGRERVLSPTDYFSVLSVGGGAGEGMYVPADSALSYAEKDGQFSLGVPGKLVKAPFEAPPLDGLKERNGIVQVINNRTIRVLTSREMAISKEGKKFITYQVYDKRNEKWTAHEIESSVNTRGFGHFLTFVVGYMEGEEHSGRRVPVPDGGSPYTLSAKLRLDNVGVNLTGQIVLLDTQRSKRAVFDVESADCDVLLVSADGEVLYRVGDTLFVRQWNGESIGKPKALVTDKEVVPAVHWAFRSTQR